MKFTDNEIEYINNVHKEILKAWDEGDIDDLANAVNSLREKLWLINRMLTLAKNES